MKKSVNPPFFASTMFVPEAEGVLLHRCEEDLDLV